MENMKSISQGAFLNLPAGYNLSKLRRRKKRKTGDDDDCELWERSFKALWGRIEGDLRDMSEKIYSKVLEDLVKHIGKLSKATDWPDDTIPCELLLTGTNLPDHTLLLDSLTRDLQNSVTKHVTALWAEDAPNLKAAVQTVVRQLVDSPTAASYDSDVDSEDEEDMGKRKRLPTSQLSMSTMASWYAEKPADDRPPVVIIVPDFESFIPTVLGNLIALLCEYRQQVPIILVLGVATSPSAMYQSLPRAVLSRLVVQLFQSEASPTFLNHVIEKVFLHEKCPFRLGHRTMTFLIDVFLFHSFSVQRFVQGLKYCMMEHFYRKDHMSLCCCPDNIEVTIKELPVEGVENIRKLPSFQKHVEACELPDRRKLLLDDKYTKTFVSRSLKALHEHSSDFIMVIKCLNILARDLPGAPLGRNVREIYARSVSSNIINDKDFKQTITLLQMQSWQELLTKVKAILDLLKIDNILDILNEEQNRFEPVIGKLEDFKKKIERMLDDSQPEVNGTGEKKDIRKDLTGMLVMDLLGPFLVAPTSLLLHEIIYFDDLTAVRRRISGAPRSAIHTALNNPQRYLECDCCELSDPGAVLPSLPDVSIAYKLYLESSKTISLFDWLQSFAAVVRPEEDAPNNGIDQQVQARFTRAVSELQFLGYIKPSKAKADQVTRLTFGSF